MQINTDYSTSSNLPIIAPTNKILDVGPRTSDAQITPTKQEENKEPKKTAHGVLRLLEAGHFMGVADVRLRVNFFEHLRYSESQLDIRA